MITTDFPKPKGITYPVARQSDADGAVWLFFTSSNATCIIEGGVSYLGEVAIELDISGPVWNPIDVRITG
jgi:hypothetical protein